MSEAFLCDGCDDFVGGTPKLQKLQYSDLLSGGVITDTYDYCDRCAKLDNKIEYKPNP